MENTERRDPIILHQVPLLSELQAKAQIISAFPNANLNVENIQLIKKEGKYQAFLMIPSALVEDICNRKELTIGKEKVFIRKHFHNFQIFVSKLADSLTAEDVKASLEAEFGPVLKVEVVQPHQGAKARWRHCYIHFQKDEDAEKCLFNFKKILVKNEEVRVARAYALGENEQTDKKLFVKILSPIDDLENLERALNDTFRREGRLREKVRVESGRTLVNFTSIEVANKVLLNSKNFKIGKLDILLRPFANKDNYTIFLSGLIASTTQSQLEQVLSNYPSLLTCSIMPSHNPLIRNATATFGSQQTFKKILTEYKQDKSLLELFANTPYITVHMSARDRIEYNSFKKGKMETQPKKLINMPLPIGMQMGGMYPPNPMAFGMMMGNPMNIPRQYN